MFKVLLVCTGNTCRSPMAEAIFKDIVVKRGYESKIETSSAGIMAWASPASKEALAVMAARGLNLDGHVSKMLTKEQIEEADLILAMTSSHKQRILEMTPDIYLKTYTLAEFADTENAADVEDPFGKSNAHYEACALELSKLLDKSFGKIVKLAGDNN